VLLDTHVLAWALLAPEALSSGARSALSEARERCLSAASIYEIVYKARIGKWPDVIPLVAYDFEDRLVAAGFEILPATGTVMQRAGALDWHHRDPFDRVIVATALTRGVPVISRDEALDGNGAAGWRRIW
jgi:PIN domain nuclease of toxin-antitoxin system